MFRTLALIGAVAPLALLPACSSQQIAGAGSDVIAACSDATAAAATAQAQLKGGALNTANATASYVTAACGTADAIAAVISNPTTAQWLGQLTQGLNDLVTGTKAAAS